MSATAVVSTAATTHTLRRAAAFSVPYSKLFLSPGNVRSSEKRSPESVRQLAAMIDADGLLADLHVSEERNAKGQPTGRYGVEAGGRRWLAIGQLVSDKKLPKDVAVPCQKVEPERATGVSLAENFAQERMHPADEFAAFSKLTAEGKSVETVAAHFGVKVIEVQRRMKLAKVAPALVAKYRKNELNLDQMVALATTDDHARQLAVWKSLPEYNRTAAGIKRRLTEDEVQATDARVRLIGLDRYKACGGTLRTDLFSDEVYLDDVGLVDLIVSEVLTEAADKLHAEGYAWVEIFETMGYQEREQFSKPPAKYLPESDADRAKRTKLEAELDALEGKYDETAESEDEGSDRDEVLEAIDRQCDEVRAKIDALLEARLDTSGYDKSALGAVVTSESGVLKIMRGLMTAKDAKAETRKQIAVKSGGTVDSVGSVDMGSKAEFSEKLMADLTSHRTAAMQAALTRDVPVALAVLADRLYVETSSAYNEGVAKISLKRCSGSLEQNGTGMTESAAAKQIDAQREHWEATVPADGTERLSWLLRQSQETVLSLLAFCTALSVDLVQRRSAPNAQADVIANALQLDVADWWSVGVDNFLTHVSKAKIAAVVMEARGAEAAAPLAAMKKGEACAAAAALLAETRWLPTPMRLGAKVDRQTAEAGSEVSPA